MSTIRTILPARVLVVWAILVAATLLSWFLGHDHGSPGTATVISVVVLVVAMIKVRLVGASFMELRDAPRGLRRAFDGWCVGVGVLMLALYLIA